MSALLRIFVLIFLAGAPVPVAADDLRPSTVELVQTDGAQWVMEWKLPVSSQSAALRARDLRAVWPEICEPDGQASVRMEEIAVFGRQGLRCEGSVTGQRFGLSALPDRTDAIARYLPKGASSQTFRITGTQLTAQITGTGSTWNVFADYLIIGAEHILLGWDHLLFVIALVFLVRRGWDVVKAATAFTVAHSLTLVATTLGYAGLPSRPVEALIALSIVFLAVEVALVLREPDRVTFTRRAPWAVAFAFGLLHGFGFAGALSEIGLPRGEFAAALVAFNLGVEAGQLLVVAVTLGALAVLSRSAASSENAVLRFATYAIGITGSFWLIERVAGF